MSAPELHDVPMSKIIEPPLPARETMSEPAMLDLVNSIRDNGLLQPIGVTSKDEAYEIIFGHRRYLAVRELKWPTIKAMVYEGEGEAKWAMMLDENIMREELNAAQEAVWFLQIMEAMKWSHEELAKRLHKSEAYVSDRLRLARDDEEIFEAVRNGRITFGVGRELNKVTDPIFRHYYLHQATVSGTSWRVVAQWVRDWKSQSGLLPNVERPKATVVEAVAGEGAAPVSCVICGGHLDTWNLTLVYIHKHELAAINDWLAEQRRNAE